MPRFPAIRYGEGSPSGVVAMRADRCPALHGISRASRTCRWKMSHYWEALPRAFAGRSVAVRRAFLLIVQSVGLARNVEIHLPKLVTCLVAGSTRAPPCRSTWRHVPEALLSFRVVAARRGAPVGHNPAERSGDSDGHSQTEEERFVTTVSQPRARRPRERVSSACNGRFAVRCGRGLGPWSFCVWSGCGWSPTKTL